MLRINNIKLKPGFTNEDVEAAIRKALRISYVPQHRIFKLSLDDRRRNQVRYIASVDVFVKNEERLLKKINNNNVMLTKETEYIFPACGEKQMSHRPVIIGAGPAGLFAALYLAKAGFKPILFERGMDVDSRTKQVRDFWEQGAPLNVNCNVQFGEGGAGTFSDGKLNTVIKDSSGRRTEVLRTFVRHGADEKIMYMGKPHVGTDVLAGVVKSMRCEIINLGGEVHFNSLFTGYEVISKDEAAVYIKRLTENHACVSDGFGQSERYVTNALVLALGHSARDTFEMLYDSGLPMEQKPFAMGLRIEHKRADIDRMKYGDLPEYEDLLPAADYKLTHQAANGRAVYSFCMCPGGYVVNASSEEGEMCVNGMSYSGRNGENSNSAIVVNVTPDDYGSEHPLAGMYFQRKWEKAAFEAGCGCVPVQLFGDYVRGVCSKKLGSVTPQIKGSFRFADLKSCLPDYINNAIIDGVMSFDKKMPGYAAEDAVLSGIEARTSSPVRMVREEDFTSHGTCIYPCGEGAGYAGGITSAAVDGIKVAEAVAQRWMPFSSDK